MLRIARSQWKDSAIKQRGVLDSCQVSFVAFTVSSSGTCQVKFYVAIARLKSSTASWSSNGYL